MKSEAKRIDVGLYGETYSIVSDEPLEKVAEIASSVDSLMQAIAKKTGLTDAKKIAVLAALKLATNQHKLESELNGWVQGCLQLAGLIDQGLKF